MVLDEAADVSPYVINQIIRPALADREGWLTISGTVKSIDDYLNVSYNTALKHPESYFTMMLKASESGILPERELLSLQQGMTEEAYQVEFECNVNAAVTGKILLPYLTQKQVTKVPYDPAGSAPITSWDLGMSDATSIWVLQMCGREPHLLDYYENTGKGLEHYVQWLSKLPYANRLGAHILPHDSKVRELGSGVSRIQLLRGMGLRNIKVAPRLPKDQQIEAARMLLPKCWVDEDNCKDGLKAIRNYSFEYDNKRQVLSQTPLHNQWSNGADAFETLAVGLRRGNTASDGIGGNDDYTFGSPIEALDNDIPVAVMYEELDTESWA
jgi:hypothetical protein